MILSPLSASDELQMTAREVKDTRSDSLSATLTLRTVFWVDNFFLLCSFTPLTTTSFLPSLPPLPLLAFSSGDWKVKERAASLIRPREPQRMELGWGSAEDLWMRLSDVITVMLSKQHLMEQVQGSALSRHLPPDRQAEKEPSSEMFLIKRCCFFPPAYQSRSQQVDWNRACLLLVLHSSLYFCKFFIYCYKVLVFLKCVFNERWLLPSWYIMSWAKTYPAQCDFSHHSIFFPTKIYVYQIPVSYP